MSIEAKDVKMTHKSSKGTKFILYYSEEIKKWTIEFSTYIGYSTYGMYKTFEKAEKNFYLIKNRG